MRRPGQLDPQSVVGRGDRGRQRLPVCPDLHLSAPRTAATVSGPGGPDPVQASDRESLVRPDRDRRGGGGDAENIAGPAVRRRDPQPEPSALADGELVGSGVVTHVGAVGVHDVSRLHAQPRGEVTGGVAVRNEADVVAVRLPGDQQTAGGCLGTHIGLHHVVQGEDAPTQLGLLQHPQHVGLILGTIGRAVQVDVVAVPDEPGVMPGGEGLEAQGQPAFEDRGELDLFVAAQARIGGAAGRVLGQEVADDVVGEPFGEVPHVERDAQQVGGPPRVVGVLQGTAASRTAAVGRRLSRQRQVHPHHVMPGVDQTRGRHRGVHSAGHGHQYAHRRSFPSLTIVGAAAARVATEVRRTRRGRVPRRPAWP